MNEAKQYVAAGLQRRRDAWHTREQQLEHYEEDMISVCNQHCADTKKLRNQEEIRRIFSAERRAAKQAKERIERKTVDAVRLYVLFCLGVMMVATWTPIEWWAAAALILGVAVFPAVYIFRLYYPID